MLTLAEAAERLNVSQNTLRQWSDAGRVTAIRRPGGGGWRKFEPTVIEELRREMGYSETEG